MGVCWYCYWGWAKPVADLYAEYEGQVGYEAMHYGRGHVVWEDENFGTEMIEWCINEPMMEHWDEACDPLVIESLKRLLEIPEDVRCCQPEDYDDERPENYPPKVEVVSL